MLDFFFLFLFYQRKSYQLGRLGRAADSLISIALWFPLKLSFSKRILLYTVLYSRMKCNYLLMLVFFIFLFIIMYFAWILLKWRPNRCSVYIYYSKTPSLFMTHNNNIYRNMRAKKKKIKRPWIDITFFTFFFFI